MTSVDLCKELCLYDLLKPRVSGVEVCNPRKNALLKDGSKSDRIDANKLSEQLYMNNIKSIYHGEHESDLSKTNDASPT